MKKKNTEHRRQDKEGKFSKSGYQEVGIGDQAGESLMRYLVGIVNFFYWLECEDKRALTKRFRLTFSSAASIASSRCTSGGTRTTNFPLYR